MRRPRGHLRKQCRCTDKGRCKHPWYLVTEARDEDGKRRRRWENTRTSRRREAEAYRTAQLSKMDSGTYVEPTKDTVAEYLSQWLDATQVRESTRQSYATHVGRINRALGHKRLVDVTAMDLDSMYASLVKSGGKKGRPLSPRSVRYTHTVVRKALSDAVRKGKLARNVADAADPPKPRRTEMTPWTEQEASAFLDHVQDDRLYALWLLYLTTGMRRGEAIGLRWQDVDLDKARASVQQTIILVGAHPAVSEPKTERGRRSVPLSADTVAALRAWKARQLQERLRFGSAWQDTGLVFTREDGVALHPERVSDWFARHRERSGLRPIRLHDLRHTFATLALAAGVPVKVVSEILGHASALITYDVYSHVVPAMQEDAVAKVAAGLLALRQETGG